MIDSILMPILYILAFFVALFAIYLITKVIAWAILTSIEDVKQIKKPRDGRRNDDANFKGTV